MAVAPPMFTDRRLPFTRNIYYHHGLDTRQSPPMALPDPAPAWPSTHPNPRPSSAYPDDVPTQLSSWILSSPPPPSSSSASWSTDSTFTPSLYPPPSKNSTDHYQPGYAGSDSASSYASEYPESSQRTDLAHAISPPSLSASPYTSPYSSSHATIPRAPSKYSLGHAIYTLDQDIHTSLSPPPPPPPARSAPRPHRAARRSPAVKIEQEDAPHDPFVHESAPAHACAPAHAQTESQVPLRATQASSEMRQMMGVFRLNPFATQGAFGGPAARASPAAEATALEEEGSVIEFQLELDGACAPRTPSPPPNGVLLRKLSPGVSPGASCYGGHGGGGGGVDRRGSPVGLQAQAQAAGGGWGYELPSEIAAYPLLTTTAAQSQAQAHSSLSMAHAAFGHALAEGGGSTGPLGEPAGAYQRYGHGHGHSHGHGHTHRAAFDAGYVDDERSHINSTSHARARAAPPTYVDGHRRYGASPVTLPSRTTTGGTGASAEYAEAYEYHDRYVSPATIPGSALAGMPSYSSSLSRRSIDHNAFYP